MDNKVLLYSTGNYIQYFIINHNGKEYFKKYVYTAEIKHCKSIIYMYVLYKNLYIFINIYIYIMKKGNMGLANLR